MVDIYPVSKQFDNDIDKIKNDISDREISIYKVADIAHEVVQEYEHGVAEPSDCEGVTLEQYKAVLHDFLLFLAHHGDDE